MGWHRTWIAALLLASSVGLADAQVSVTVRNMLNDSRFGETVEVDMAVLKANKALADSPFLIVKDVDGNEIPSQVTFDGKLIFQVGIPAKGKVVYSVFPSQKAPVYETNVFGRCFPERMDDIAWENDRVAFRTYGPALQKNNEKAYGIDVWNKRVPRLVVEERYASELDANVSATISKLRNIGKDDLADDVYNAVSYHVDHGTGMDCYKVGSTLGCGTPALLDGDAIVYPWCWKEYEILDKGPLRFSVRLKYNAVKVGGKNFYETRVISLDAGSQLNRCMVSYTDDEGNDATGQKMGVGIVVHKENPSGWVCNAKSGYMGYEDLGDPNQYKQKYRAVQNKDFGFIYVGAVFPDALDDMKYKEEQGLPGANGHILGISSFKAAGKPLTYYFGSGWSRNPGTDFTSMAKWEKYLDSFASQVRNPLKVSVK